VNRRTVFYWLIGIVIAAVVIGVAFYLDEAARHFIAHHQNRVGYNLMRNVSRLGDWPEHFALGVMLTGIAWWRGSKKWTRIFLSMLIALAIAGVVGRGIQVVTGRARPSVKTEEVWNGLRFSSKYHAFPSGHVGASSAFFAVLFLANWRIGLASAPVPIVIGFSRMYVGAHYLSDVVCAAVLGVICAILVARLLWRNIEHRALNWRRG
jgi:membrane-associated phospholipid phosphatase